MDLLGVAALCPTHANLHIQSPDAAVGSRLRTQLTALEATAAVMSEVGAMRLSDEFLKAIRALNGVTAYAAPDEDQTFDPVVLKQKIHQDYPHLL